MYKCVIFDIDGTLLDTEKAILSSLQKLLKVEKNICYSFEELSFALGIPGHVTLEKLNASDIDRGNHKWNNYLKEYADEIKLFPVIEKMVKDIHESKVKTGIVTSKTRKEFDDDFSYFGLSHYFDYTVCADDTNKHKPDAEPLNLCLVKASVLPNEALYIGDTVYDMLCANSAGVDFGLALWGTKNSSIQAKYRFSNPQEITDLILTSHHPFSNN